jgi:hypothetical protein
MGQQDIPFPGYHLGIELSKKVVGHFELLQQR